MNAHLPVVRPLLCYARRGATPMHQKSKWRDDPSTKQALKMHQGRAQGGDQALLAAIARVSAAKSETWILVLCLRM